MEKKRLKKERESERLLKDKKILKSSKMLLIPLYCKLNTKYSLVLVANAEDSRTLSFHASFSLIFVLLFGNPHLLK